MSQKRRSDSNSTTAAVEGFRGAIQSVPLPDGVVLRSDDEIIIWDQFTRARAREDWRDMDLILLAKVVRMEADIRKHQETLDRSGVLIKNQRGTLIPNPLISVIDTLERLLSDIAADREILETALNLSLTVMSHHTNQTMNRLAVVSTIFLPLSFICGIYGMNFEGMPEVDWANGYLYFWGLCGCITVGLVMLLRRARLL